MRDDKMLEEMLENIWKKYFLDVPRLNRVTIKYGRRAKKRLGSITSLQGNDINTKYDTHILINGHFKDKKIPKYVIEATIAHELCHYSHGFSSPLPQACSFPHRGEVVDKEMEKRGLDSLSERGWRWLQRYWSDYLMEAS